jgi:two-component system response regulator PilR (NtrC family)
MDTGELITRVLVVDDETDVRTTVSMLLRHLGFETETAASAAEAVALIQNTKFSLVLSDILLPGGTGETIHNFIHDQGIKLPIAFMSGSVPLDIEERLSLRAGENFLRKPFTLAELRALLQRYLPHYQFRVPPAAKKPSAS